METQLKAGVLTALTAAGRTEEASSDDSDGLAAPADVSTGVTLADGRMPAVIVGSTLSCTDVKPGGAHARTASGRVTPRTYRASDREMFPDVGSVR